MNSLSPIDVEYGAGAPPVTGPTRSEKMFRSYYGQLVDGLTFPNNQSPQQVAPEWWVVQIYLKSAGQIIIKRSGGDDVTLDLLSGIYQLALPGRSNTITFSVPVAIIASSVTVFAVIGYSPADIIT